MVFHWPTPCWYPLHHSCSYLIFLVFCVSDSAQPPDGFWFQACRRFSILLLTCHSITMLSFNFFFILLIKKRFIVFFFLITESHLVIEILENEEKHSEKPKHLLQSHHLENITVVILEYEFPGVFFFLFSFLVSFFFFFLLIYFWVVLDSLENYWLLEHFFFLFIIKSITLSIFLPRLSPNAIKFRFLLLPL